jgi:hypothetical protein
MSHTTSIKGIKITEVSALRKAIAELAKGGMKIALLENAIPRAYFQNQAGMGRADFVVQLQDAKYDIGLYKQPDGSYEPRTDFFGGSVEKLLGAVASKKENAEQAKLGKMMQLYGIHAATEKATKSGYAVQRQAGKDGAIKLVLTGFA